jgi:hypothetical protein
MDLEHPVTRQSVIDALDRWLAVRPAQPYAALFAAGASR